MQKELKNGIIFYMSPNLFPSKKQFPKPETASERIPQQEQKVDSTVETGREIEQLAERQPVPDQETDYGRATAPVPVQHAKEPQRVGGEKTPELVEIENILSEHLEELFVSLSDSKKTAFKEKGEEAAQTIDSLLKQTKIKVKQILQTIISWLSIIPGINKFFIEQQAEIKTNKLLALRNKETHT